MFQKIKKLFISKKTTPGPPRGQAAYIEWLNKYHPDYQTPAQPDEQGGLKGPNLPDTEPGSVEESTSTFNPPVSVYL